MSAKVRYVVRYRDGIETPPKSLFPIIESGSGAKLRAQSYAKGKCQPDKIGVFLEKQSGESWKLVSEVPVEYPAGLLEHVEKVNNTPGFFNADGTAKQLSAEIVSAVAKPTVEITGLIDDELATKHIEPVSPADSLPTDIQSLLDGPLATFHATEEAKAAIPEPPQPLPEPTPAIEAAPVAISDAPAVEIAPAIEPLEKVATEIAEKLAAIEPMDVVVDTTTPSNSPELDKIQADINAEKAEAEAREDARIEAEKASIPTPEPEPIEPAEVNELFREDITEPLKDAWLEVQSSQQPLLESYFWTSLGITEPAKDSPLWLSKVHYTVDDLLVFDLQSSPKFVTPIVQAPVAPEPAAPAPHVEQVKIITVLDGKPTTISSTVSTNVVIEKPKLQPYRLVTGQPKDDDRIELLTKTQADARNGSRSDNARWALDDTPAAYAAAKTPEHIPSLQERKELELKRRQTERAEREAREEKAKRNVKPLHKLIQITHPPQLVQPVLKQPVLLRKTYEPKQLTQPVLKQPILKQSPIVVRKQLAQPVLLKQPVIRQGYFNPDGTERPMTAMERLARQKRIFS